MAAGCVMLFLFFKQKTAYEMRISDWSSDVCSSDLRAYLSLLADRARLDGMARAISHLATPIDPKDSLAAFLEEVRAAFSSTCVELVLFDAPEEIGRASCRERVAPYG